ncbi:MAG: IscS subfamily cysteine desulfurase [Saprospiraceae bacterium]|nr:IscS subfamily cysteine desulfurase [Saprospiraceae bacterium]
MNKKDLIYLDYNSTTPVDPEVLAKMLPYFHDIPGNAASRSHPFGWIAEEAVDNGRKQLAQLLNVDPKEIVFTSGATEGDNLILKGIFEMYYRKGKHIITLETEHKAVLDACQKIEKSGGEVTYLKVDQYGTVDLEELEKSITEKTILVSIMWANNETGVIQPMKEIGEICERKGVLFMSDATQAMGKIPVSPKEVGVHLLAFSAHKMYGPKGVGAIYVCGKNPRVKLTAQLDGGGHEKGMRSGTLNVPGIVGFGAAASLLEHSMDEDSNRIKTLRDRLESELLKIEESYLNGDGPHRLPNVSNLAFRFVESEALIATFNQTIAVSTGSACTSASLDPSHVLIGMGRSEDMAHSSIRFSLGRYTTAEEIDRTIDLVQQGVEKLRQMSPIWEMFKDGIDVS